tara:strand:+ start:555 stop:746 length:192 start_codon:yes stop_codon:yes gene_type:complete
MKYRICVDLDSAQEDAEFLEEQVIEADNEEEALKKAQALIKKEQIGGPYYNLTEYDPTEGSED